MERLQKFLALFAFLVFIPVTNSALAAPPVMNIEGEGGGGLVPWAYLTNPPKEGKVFGKPVVGATYIFPENFDVTVYHVNETITDRLELGYSRTVFDTTNLLGIDTATAMTTITTPVDGSVTVSVPTGFDIGFDELVMDTIHAKLLVLKETDTLPAVSVSVEYKDNKDMGEASKKLGLKSVGFDGDTGWDYCLSVTKLLKAETTPLHMPILVNVGARLTKANQTGYLGFSSDYRVLPEVSLAVMPESSVAVGFEYRGKPDEFDGPGDLFHEDDWTDFFIAYFPTRGLSITGAVVNFGNIVNRNVDTGLYMNMKYDF